MPEFREVQFVCPKCGSNVISLVQNVLEYVEIVGIDPDQCYLDPGDTLDGQINEQYDYQCHKCGFKIGDVEMEVAAWLVQNNMVGK
jgi:DNA-directed RNA polymerase subunit RPC12/RpoP